ncbi:hypothetical protein [Streptomyces sp. NPDC058457]|uniref:hypothetical protein n=1 Tax=Streptomyces sp. NPDC058457 TaxID=3346507 RepID=UPI003659EDE8
MTISVNGLSIDIVSGSPTLTVQTNVGIFKYLPGKVPSRLGTDEEEGSVIRCYAQQFHQGQDITFVGTSHHSRSEYQPDDSTLLGVYQPMS